jgi:Tfp pilus assembly protein PilO
MINLRQFHHYLRQPYAPLFPCAGLAGFLLVAAYLLHVAVLEPADQERQQLQAAWVSARLQLARHTEARQTKEDLRQVWAVFPLVRDFAPLALGVTEEAKRDHITLPALSYKTERTVIPDAIKAILQGTVTGRYEDLRKFLYNLETAQELLFIEDLNLIRSGNLQDPTLTFNIRISTYLRGEPAQVRSLENDARSQS